MKRNRFSPQLFEQVHLIDAGAKGVAVGRAEDGRVIFVRGGVPGDVADIRIYKKKKAYYEGEIAQLHQPSSHRTAAVCQHFGACGGCKWQHMSYDSQLHFKQKEVLEHLSRIGKVALPECQPILGSQEVFGYRNKMEYSFSSQRWLTPDEIRSGLPLGGQPALGFHIPGMWDKILDIEHCHLQAEPGNAIRNFVRAEALRQGLSFYNVRENQGLLRSLMIRQTRIGQCMVLFQFGADEPAQIQSMLDALIAEFPNLTSVQYTINLKANDSIYDQDIIHYHGQPYIEEQLAHLRFRITAKSFYQTNSDQAAVLYQAALELADLKGHENVYDLYTGTGTIALYIAQKAKRVVGVEAVPEAIADAQSNAERNGIDNCTFVVGDMKSVFNAEFIQTYGPADVVITDPPRDGMHQKVVEQLLALNAPKIVYISCNSATQARDLALLDSQYEVKAVQPVDMFPQTHHVENVVLLTRRHA